MLMLKPTLKRVRLVGNLLNKEKIMAFGNNKIEHPVTSNADRPVVYMLKDEKGQTVGTYKVPKEEVDSFQAKLDAECKRLTQACGSTVRAVKIELL